MLASDPSALTDVLRRHWMEVEDLHNAAVAQATEIGQQAVRTSSFDFPP